MTSLKTSLGQNFTLILTKSPNDIIQPIILCSHDNSSSMNAIQNIIHYSQNAAQTSAAVSHTSFTHAALGAALPSAWQAGYYHIIDARLATCVAHVASTPINGLAACRNGIGCDVCSDSSSSGSDQFSALQVFPLIFSTVSLSKKHCERATWSCRGLVHHRCFRLRKHHAFG